MQLYEAVWVNNNDDSINIKGNIVNYSCFFLTKSGVVSIDETTQSDNWCNTKRTEKVCKYTGLEKSRFTNNINQQY